MEKLHIEYPILVEGKYDKIKLDSILDAHVITTDGFRIFKDDEKRAFLRALSQKSKLIVLSDSDSAGMMIRSHIKGIIPNDRIINLYTPQIKGKEKRKLKQSKEGFVGVEGVDADIIRKLFEPFASSEIIESKRKITKGDLFALGLSGSDNSAELRGRVCVAFGLPHGISANAMLDALNILCDFETLAETVRKITD